MVTYEYECRDCGHCFEQMQSMTDEPLTNCPECGGGIERVIGGGIGFLIKSARPSCPGAEMGACRDRVCGGNSPTCEFAER